MNRLLRLIACLALLGTPACVADAVTGVEAAPPESEAEAREAAPEPAQEPAPEPEVQRAAAPAAFKPIVLRSSASIISSTGPLFIVDGVALNTSDPLSVIDPDSIESIEVLKGANAAALYGSRAARGVVIITTRAGAAARRRK